MALVDTDALESLLTEADRLAVQLHGNNENDAGLIAEIKDCVKCMEDAIADLGGAYQVENEAAERLEKARSDLNALVENLSSNLVKELESTQGGLRDTIGKILNEAIAGESEKIVKELAKTLKADLLYDVREESVREVLGRNVEVGSKAALAARVRDLEATQAVYKEHYKEANFWRGASPWLIGLSIVGGASLAALVGVVYLANTGAIQVLY